MTLDSNAIITVDDFLTSSGSSRDEFSVAALKIYNGSSDATAATVGLADNTLTLIVTGGANAGTSTFDLTNASYDTISELITGIEALSKGWIVNRQCASAQTSSDLFSFSTTSVLLQANELTLNAFNSLLIEQIINSSSSWIENFCRRKFATQTHTEYYDGNNYIHLKLDNFPVTAHTSVALWDSQEQTVLETLTDNVDYEFYNEEGTIYKGSGWAKGTKNWRVIYTAGYSSSTMPEDLKQACMQLCNLLYNKRDKAGYNSETIGMYSVSYTSSANKLMGVGVPDSIIGMLAPYVRYDFSERTP